MAPRNVTETFFTVTPSRWTSGGSCVSARLTLFWVLTADTKTHELTGTGLLRCRSGRAIWVRVHHSAGANLLHAFHDHAVAGFEALLDDPAVVYALTDDYAAGQDFVFRIHGINGLEALHFLHGSLRNHDDALSLRGGHADRSALAW